MKPILPQNYGTKHLLVLALVFSFLAFPRLLSTSVGLPYSQFWDEPMVTRGALNGLKRAFDEDPTSTLLPMGNENVYGGLLRYSCMLIDLFYYTFLKYFDSSVSSLSDVKTDINGTTRELPRGTIPETLSHPGFYLFNRLFVTILNLFGIYGLFLVTRLRNGFIPGLISIALLGAIYPYYASSFIVWVDVPLSTWTIFTLYFALKYNKSKITRHLLYCLLFSGLAMSTKLSGAATIIIPFTAAVLNHRLLIPRMTISNTAKVGILTSIPFGIFLILNPSIYLDSQNFFRWIIWIRELYESGEGFFRKEPGFEHLIYQFSQFQSNTSTFVIALASLGLIVNAAKLVIGQIGISRHSNSDFLIIIIFPIAYTIYVTSGYSIAFHRNFLLIYPIICFLATEGICFTVDTISRAICIPRNRRVLTLSLTFAAVILSESDGYFRIMTDAVNAYSSEDTRSTAINDIRNISSKQTIHVGIDERLMISSHDLRDTEFTFEVQKVDNLLSTPSRYSLIILPEYKNTLSEPEMESSIGFEDITDLIDKFRIVSREGTEIEFSEDRKPWVPLRNPAINILAIRPTWHRNSATSNEKHHLLFIHEALR